MAVRETEKYLPVGGAKFLGECDEALPYALVAYMKSPVPVGWTLDFVVFATNDAPATAYNWIFREIPSGYEYQVTTLQGFVDYQPKNTGTLEVEVQIVDGVPPTTLMLKQDVTDSTAHLYTQIDSSPAATAGDRNAMLELVQGLRPFILEATSDPANSDIPAALVASIAYWGVDRTRPSERKVELDNAAQLLNGLATPVVPVGMLNNASSPTNDDLYDYEIGVCQLLPEIAAMIASKDAATPPATFTPWTETPAGERPPGITRGKIRSAYDGLPPVSKIVIYNLLRFPRSSVRLCTALLKKLKQRRWSALTADDLLKESSAIILQTLVTELRSGATTEPSPSIPPAAAVANALVPSAEAKKIAGLLGRPFIFAQFGGYADISGGVITGTNTPVAGARIDLIHTVARIKAAGGLKCYPTASVTAAPPIATLPSNVEYGVVDIQWDLAAKTIWAKLNTPLGDAWIKAKDGSTRDAAIYEDRLVQAAATSGLDGQFTCRVTNPHLHRVHVVADGYLDGVSDAIVVPNASISILLTPAAKAIPETAVTDLLKDFLNYDYRVRADKTEFPAKYPYSLLPGVKINIEGKNYNDCSTFTEGLLVKAWQNSLKEKFSWSLNLHNQWMIDGTKPDKRFSPMDAATTAEMIGTTTAVDNVAAGDPAPGPWTLIQGFVFPTNDPTKDWTNGHSFIVVDRYQVPGPDRNQDLLLILESNKPGSGLDGPGFRGIGDLDLVAGQNPGRDWWNRAGLPTWASVKKGHPFIRMAPLLIRDVRLVR